MKKIEYYSHKTEDEKGTYQNYFYGIINYKEDGSKNCCGFYQDGFDLITICSDSKSNGEEIVRFFDYGPELSTQMIFKVRNFKKYFDYMTEIIDKCASLDRKDIINVLSSVGNVSPEWDAEKFKDSSEIFSKLESGKTLGEVVGSSMNVFHNNEAWMQTPTFENTGRSR